MNLFTNIISTRTFITNIRLQYLGGLIEQSSCIQLHEYDIRWNSVVGFTGDRNSVRSERHFHLSRLVNRYLLNNKLLEFFLEGV